LDVQRAGTFYDDFHLVHLLGRIGYGAVPGSPNSQESDTRARSNSRGFLAGSRLHADSQAQGHYRQTRSWDGAPILIPRGAGVSRP
jgi:hypothetical protein